MISFGLTFLFANLLYLLIAIAAGFIVYRVLTKKELLTLKSRRWLSVGVFAFVLVLPFYDLLIQKAVKTYYQAFKMDSTIYAYPEKDENGKIESLGVGGVNRHTLHWFTKHLEQKKFDFMQFNASEMKVKKKNFWGWYKNNIKNFIEIGVYDDSENVKLFRIEYSDYSIKPIKQQEARYQVYGQENKCLFDLCEKRVYTFVDTAIDKKMAEAYLLYFPTDKENFRNRYLGWRGPSGIAFHIDTISNGSEVLEELFGIRMNLGKVTEFNQDGEGKRR